MSGLVQRFGNLSPEKREELMRRLKHEAAGASAPDAIPSRDKSLPPPLSFAQQRLWFIDQLQPGLALYNLPIVLRATGPLNVEAFQRALQALVDRHEVLRTTFTQERGQPVQRIAPTLELTVSSVDLRALPEPERDAEALRLAKAEMLRPFDLEKGPLLRATWIRLDANDHVLALVLHHIVFDIWSMGVLVREVLALYDAFSHGRQATLPPPKIQYADWAVWQRGSAQQAVLEKQLAYWRERLTGLEMLELPTDHPRAGAGVRGGALPFRIQQGPWEALKAHARKEGVTPFMVLLAALEVVLAHESGQYDVAVGTPVAGRNRREVEGLIGFFVSTVVMRTDLSGNPTLRELLGRVRKTCVEAYAQQDIPLEQIVAALQPGREAGQTPFYRVSFNFQNSPLSEVHIPGLVLRPIVMESGLAKLDLSLQLTEGAEGLTGLWEYSTDLYEERTVLRWMDGFQRVVRTLVEKPELRIGDVEWMGAEERRRVVEEWNRTQKAYGPKDECGHEVFEAVVDARPEAEAVRTEAGGVSYAEVDAKANQLAHHLKGLGVGPEVRVGLLVERSVEWVVGMLAVLKAGGAFVPVDVTLPAMRVGELLEESGVALVLTNSTLADELPTGNAVLVLLDDDSSRIVRQPKTRPAKRVGPESLAYVLFTSGSTGKPKGVMVRHGSLANMAHAVAEAHGVKPEDRVLQYASPGFDASVAEVFSTLAAGASLCLAPREALMPGGALEATVKALGATVVTLTPSVLGQVQDGGLEGIRTLISAGEAVPSALVRKWSEGRRMLNGYGPTEVTVCASVATSLSPERVTVGKPLGNVRLYVLDEAQRPVGVGVVGELYVGGAGLARGYLGQPALTAERFLPDGFSGEAGSRLYRTGDLVRWGEDGDVEYVGRRDGQVKVRGMRLEVGEVEGVLATHPAVKQAAVVAKKDATGTKLWAYVVGDVEAAALREWLRERVPEHMVPTAYGTLEALPLTSSGKVDRAKLPALTADATPRAHVFTAPRTPVEQLIADQWAELLKVERVGLTDNFFDLGGHSLIGTQVVSRLRELFGVELPLQQVFDAPTVELLAARVDALRARSEGASAMPPVSPVSREAALPLSFAQQRLWFLDRLEPGSPLYNVPAAVRLSGALDVGVLERCFAEILRRHEVLRTTFPVSRQTPVQEIHTEGRLPLEVRDLNALDESRRHAEVLRLAEEEARKPFDLSQGPLVRGVLLKLGATEHVLLLTMHHIVSDAWSTGILLRELGAFYPAYLGGEEPSLPELAVQYADYAAWQRSWLSEERLASELGWWKARLDGAPALLELPADHPRPAVQTHRGTHRVQRMPLELQEGVRRLARSEGVTPFMVLLAAFNALLSHLSGREDIVIGTDVAGRDHREVEGLIGFFINQLVLRTRVERGASFRELLGGVRETTLSAYAHQHVPFEKLVEAINPERSLGHAPLFQVKLLLQNAPVPELRLPGLSLRGVDFETGTAKLDLIVSFTEGAEGLTGLWEYSTDLYEERTVRRWMEGFERVVRALVEKPEQRVGDVEWMGAEERRQVVEAWNRTGKTYGPKDECGHEVFEAVVDARPEAEAVRTEAGGVSYAELEVRANQLAHHLKGQGVGPEVRVGLLVERSVEWVVGMLAVLKAGGAFVPVDVTLPAMRVGELLEESGVALVLTREELADELPTGNAVLAFVDADARQVATQPKTRPAKRVGPESLAYVLFTSGSTGKPKGVMVRHGSLANMAHAVAEAHGVKPEDRVLQYASPGFDASVAEVFSTLAAGASLCLAPREALMPGGALEATVKSLGATVVTLTPSVLGQVQDGGLEGIRTLISAGEAVPAALVRKWSEGRRMLNGYGPTEVTVCASVATSLSPERVTVGKPLGNVRLYVLDEAQRPVGVGVVGELYVGGAGLARGYLGQPALTAERFLPDGFSGEASSRLYRTGDLVRWGEDGDVEYVGRRDGQVKVRGMRLEVGEVEGVLATHPAVKQAAVVAKKDATGTKLWAYVVGDVETAALREWLRERVPEHMVPTAYGTLEALPLTSSGKVDRAKLPALTADATPRAHVFTAPRTPVEQLIADQWAELLKVERVGLTDNFFDLGGHSLIATQVVTRLGALFGRELALADLFERPTVLALAELLQASGTPEGAKPLPPVVPTSPTDTLPLSFSQEVYWSPEQGGADSAHNASPVVLGLGGMLDVAAMKRGVEEIVRRHESLRTTFPTVDGKPRQHILPPGPIPFEVEKLDTLPEAEREAEALRRAGAQMDRPFDLERGPLLRCHLYRLGAEQHVLLVNMHHAVTDFVSFSVFAGELAVLYAAFREGRESPLPELPIQYQDFTRWQHAWLNDGALERLRTYWSGKLAGPPEDVRLPLDFPRPAQESLRGASLDLVLPPELVARLKQLCRAEGVTLFMVLLSAFQVLLSRRAGQEDIRVGFAHAQRPRPELEPLIGMFAGYLVIRTRMEQGLAPREALARVRTAYLEAFAHQGLPHAELVRVLPGLCRIGFTFSDREGNGPQVPGLAVRPLMRSRGWTLYDLKLGVSDTPGGLIATLEYKVDLFRPDTIAELLHEWRQVLQSFCEAFPPSNARNQP
ncbi:Long-chain-fatty-acid--CoA ligase [Corallococcus coralloides DSM 2259]|uniref:Long-chain-fatty-acid--CoA ligase n=1 Tax=Corallococcus coralloides (strain ATCC 25202 / DSM 2259 / NBRC 100086 / M2) TaxID=1144275 RepID=H8N206_CORCM|nr:non-ribosomal peptide synthetase [Corallococcus coralloides]AFE10580.1 Long-chain-fatty-acid--CoA ligase [Corallococcus coralloides DSM 2259]